MQAFDTKPNKGVVKMTTPFAVEYKNQINNL